MRTKLIIYVCMVFTAVAVIPRFAAASEDNTQTAELHQLQEAFHAAGSVHDNINGDSADVITQRIREMMSLWTRDGVMMLAVGGAFDGKYMGRGDPDDPSTCPEPSSDSNNRGTLCTLFKYVHGAFKPANKLISLTSAYKTSFDVEGNLAAFYFECHYFNVAIDPNTGTPFWTAATHLSLNGVAQKVHRQWRLAYGIVHVPPVPLPVP
jgi:hypothetical protein